MSIPRTCEGFSRHLTRKFPAGSDKIQRQVARFPEFRKAMLSSLQKKLVHKGWRGSTTGDRYMNMICEFGAYAFDVISFYDYVIFNECYLSTARRKSSLVKLVELLGYIPQPAVGSVVDLAVFAEGKKPVTLPRGTAFRSGGFDGEAPQVFQLDEDFVVHPFANKWDLLPPRPKVFGEIAKYTIIPFASSERLSSGTSFQDTILVERRTSTMEADDLILASSGDPAVQPQAVKVIKLNEVEGWNGEYYQTTIFDRYLYFPYNTPLADIRLLKSTRVAYLWIAPAPSYSTWTVLADERVAEERIAPYYSEKQHHFDFSITGQRDQSTKPELVYIHAGRSRFLEEYVPSPLVHTMIPAAVPGEFYRLDTDLRVEKSEVLLLDGIYKDIRPGEDIVVSWGDGKSVFKVHEIAEILQPYSIGQNMPSAHIPLTRLTLKGTVSIPREDITRINVHFNFIEAGHIAAQPQEILDASIRLDIAELLEKPIEHTSPSRFILEDKNQSTIKVTGRIQYEENALDLNQDQLSQWKLPFAMPINIYGNVVRASRGETVAEELLGIGDSSVPNQSFKLKKKPLTYHYHSPGNGGHGPVSTLKIHVDGILWKEVTTFLKSDSDDHVYIVRQDEEEESTITFGDGIKGSRLPTGARVIADYRFGAGAAAPPAGSITQIATPVKGIRSVKNPASAYGGDGSDNMEKLRSNAPQSALVLDRIVSLKDLEAMAGRAPGVRAVQVGWDWHPLHQRPVAQVWYIGDEGINQELLKTLRDRADPSVPISVRWAEGNPVTLSMEIEIDPLHFEKEVLDTVRMVLLDKDSGILAPERIGIGRPLFRSGIFKAVCTVSGVLSVRTILWNGESFSDYTKKSATGRYFDLEAGELILKRFDKDV